MSDTPAASCAAVAAAEPPRWPRGIRCAVVVSVDLDAELPLLAADPTTAQRVKTLSVGRYGATRGVDRLLAEFQSQGVTATWCVPGRNAERYPHLLHAIAGHGHEIAHHGHAHEDFSGLGLAGQLDVVDRGSAAIADVTGERPRGFRIPAGEWAAGFPDALVDRGFAWSSSLHGDDLPHFHPARTAGPRTGTGTERRLTEIPVHHELHDHPYFFFNLDPAFPAGQSRIAPYREVLGNWTTEFDAYHRFGLCYVLRLQPEVTGTPGRIGLVRELLRHIRSHDDVWIATAGEVAEWWAARNATNAPGHPAEVFGRLTRELA
ncbi:polysaccharide deacetylase family protein [Streptomyces sp. NBC_00455]|uniref:polysaccharide deacetylase family protein n=1 Tax=Streptomyces sp. NBC_00455 TaxID=2903654 RepID=UPI002E1B60AB